MALDTTFSTGFFLANASRNELASMLPQLDLSSADLRQHHDEESLRALIEFHHDTHDEEGRPLVGSAALGEFSYHFGEHGVYTVILRDAATPNDKGAVVAQIEVSREPDDANVPIYIAMGIIGALAIVYLVGTCVWLHGSRKWEEHQHKQNGTEALDSMYGGQVTLVPILHRRNPRGCACMCACVRLMANIRTRTWHWNISPDRTRPSQRRE
jgi:hypothetical protein